MYMSVLPEVCMQTIYMAVPEEVRRGISYAAPGFIDGCAFNQTEPSHWLLSLVWFLYRVWLCKPRLSLNSRSPCLHLTGSCHQFWLAYL